VRVGEPDAEEPDPDELGVATAVEPPLAGVPDGWGVPDVDPPSGSPDPGCPGGTALGTAGAAGAEPAPPPGPAALPDPAALLAAGSEPAAVITAGCDVASGTDPPVAARPSAPATVSVTPASAAPTLP
jgi:hypothetical protein